VPNYINGHFFLLSNLSIESFTTKGAEQTMEETHFLIFQLSGVNHIFAFGVFDGHHGNFSNIQNWNYMWAQINFHL
jgi:hypothetical protein